MSAIEGTVAVTDLGWYKTLLAASPLEEVNFWKPSPKRTFNGMEYAPFFFKLKAPHNAICGMGFFVRYARLPVRLAWDCFGVANGTSTFAELTARLQDIRARIHYEPEGVDRIGCIVLTEPTFFPRELWVTQPTDWPARTLADKKYDLASGEGARVWKECAEAAAIVQQGGGARVGVAERPSPRYTEIIAKRRIGQGAFRVAVTEAYDWACSVTGEHSAPALEAAHIVPYSDGGPNEVPNGLLLRADVHRLFDEGYVTVTPDLRLEVSARLRADYQNGRTYYPYHGKRLELPERPDMRPRREYLQWHNEHCYLG